MTPEAYQDLIRAFLKSEDLTLSFRGKVLDPMEEAVTIRDMTELLHDASILSPVRAEGSLTASIKAQRWDERPTDEVPAAFVQRLAEVTRQA